MTSDLRLIIDVGNTSIKMVCFDGMNAVDEVRINNICDNEALDFISRHKFSKGIYCSTVLLNDGFMDFIGNLHFPMLYFQPGITAVPIRNLYKTPLTLGSDRLAAVVGASLNNKGMDILVIDVGTCITYDFINSKGEYEGGNISPGIEMRLKSLHAFTSKLPSIDAEGRITEIGDSTETAIRSGVINGVKREIEGYINIFGSKYSQLYIYLTGGSHVNLHFSEKNHTFAPANHNGTMPNLVEDGLLVPKGLNAILEYNKEQ
ncbi:type III pantothenate kinase [Prevotella sp. OH937_COT-195]|uniref:type III pantothenate kinase n=1 Tax=Prevotella sp. OH937_COT-195 TaxID=2491051 RepID=UPI001F22FFA7|nr:type III pantothenate kinase [Prevotella sp. OH937_COT-195]